MKEIKFKKLVEFALAINGHEFPWLYVSNCFASCSKIALCNGLC